MGLYVTEHIGSQTYRQPINQANARASYYLSTATTAAQSLQAGTKYVRITADSGSYFNNSTTSGSLALTSTNSFRIAANTDGELFSVSTANKVQTAST